MGTGRNFYGNGDETVQGSRDGEDGNEICVDGWRYGDSFYNCN